MKYGRSNADSSDDTDVTNKISLDAESISFDDDTASTTGIQRVTAVRCISITNNETHLINSHGILVENESGKNASVVSIHKDLKSLQIEEEDTTTLNETEQSFIGV